LKFGCKNNRVSIINSIDLTINVKVYNIVRINNSMNLVINNEIYGSFIVVRNTDINI